MPYKSQAQRRLFHHLVKQGKIAPEVVEEYDRESKGKRVPERVERKAHGGEVMEPTTYRARGGEVERKSRGDSRYDAKSADEFLTKLDSAIARIKRMDSNLPYNPAPWHERTDEERGPVRMSADPAIPKRRGFGFMDMLGRYKSPTFLDEGNLGSRQEEYKKEPTPENARRVSRAAKELSDVDPKFSEEWRKNTSGRMGDLKAADRYARGGEVYVPLKALGGLIGDMKELYPEDRKSFAKALRRRR